jgi:predicted AAA+ superfamily ATPase
MKIQRILLDTIERKLEKGKVLILYGPRRVGKTTLLKNILSHQKEKYLLLNGDELSVRELLASQDKQKLGELLGENAFLAIDEAQRIENIGLNLKILVDNFPDRVFLASGSASFDLANKVNEPLTGRKNTTLLYPISFGELKNVYGLFEAKRQLERWLIFGTYPEVITTENVQKRKQYLDELVGSYLYKDILEMEGLKHPEKLVNILRLLAFQIGNEVSLAELASNLAINRETVERYLDLLEKSFVIFKVSGFSRNLRKEIVKNNRYYFYDNGVRNSLIQNFNALHLRSDIGKLWENFLFIERIKVNHYNSRAANIYFWRTYDQKEIDLIEEREGKLFGFEFKWQGQAKQSNKDEFLRVYKNAKVQTINKDNFEAFLGVKT